MKTCSTCVYYRQYNWATYGFKSVPQMVCERIEPDYGLHVQIDGNKAVMEVSVHDDQGLDVYFIPGPDFGCTLHEDRN